MSAQGTEGTPGRARWLIAALVASIGVGAGDVVSAQAADPAFVLSGIVIDAQGTSRAIIEEPQLTGGRSVMFRVGDMVGQYRLVTIEPDQAVLERPGGSTVRLRLSGTPGGPVAVAAPTDRTTAEKQAPARRSAGPPPTEERRRAMQSPPPGPGEPALRPAWEGPSRPDPRPPAFDADDFKRQIQQQLLMGGSPKK